MADALCKQAVSKQTFKVLQAYIYPTFRLALLEKDVRIAVASGIACYEAGKEYEHGGISPQECIVPVITVSKPVAAAAQEVAVTGVTWKGLRCTVNMTGAGAGMTADIRTKAGNAATSLAAPKPIETGAASLLVPDDDQLGAAAFAVVLAADGSLAAQMPTTVGGQM